MNAFYNRIELQNVWGHVNMFARGAGQAIAQLDVNYGVDFEPFKVSGVGRGIHN